MSLKLYAMGIWGYFHQAPSDIFPGIIFLEKLVFKLHVQPACLQPAPRKQKSARIFSIPVLFKGFLYFL